MSGLLSIRDLRLVFGGLAVLDEVSLDVEQGEVMALIGPNGAGKTALVNCISGIYRPDPASRILLHGEPIASLEPHRIAACGVARTFQHAHILGSLTVLDNVLLGLAPQVRCGVATRLAAPWIALREERALADRGREALRQCGIEHLADVSADGLPLGVRRRVDLARALVSRPTLLLLDEPASGLAHDERSLILELINIARGEREIGVVWIEHDLDLVVSAADSVTVMHHGKVVATGAPRASAKQRQSLIDAYMRGA
ncbi:MAG: ABC transporter ATP-binding protein [Flavobacteriaceae bacterium]